MSRHVQKRVPAPAWTGRKRIRVDADLAPLLREVWRRGFATWVSCQDRGDGTAYIVFVSVEQAREFARHGAGSERPDGWRYVEIPNPYGRTDPMCAVYFPRVLLTRFAARHRGHGKK